MNVILTGGPRIATIVVMLIRYMLHIRQVENDVPGPQTLVGRLPLNPYKTLSL
jgi:hypothetical protein